MPKTVPYSDLRTANDNDDTFFILRFAAVFSDLLSLGRVPFDFSLRPATLAQPYPPTPRRTWLSWWTWDCPGTTSRPRGDFDFRAAKISELLCSYRRWADQNRAPSWGGKSIFCFRIERADNYGNLSRENITR